MEITGVVTEKKGPYSGGYLTKYQVRNYLVKSINDSRKYRVTHRELEGTTFQEFNPKRGDLVSVTIVAASEYPDTNYWLIAGTIIKSKKSLKQ